MVNADFPNIHSTKKVLLTERVSDPEKDDIELAAHGKFKFIREKLDDYLLIK